MAQLAIDLLYREIIFGIGTSCPPSITRLAIRAAFIVGESVQTKNIRIKYPKFLALRIKSILSGPESTVSKMRLLLFKSNSSLNFSA